MNSLNEFTWYSTIMRFLRAFVAGGLASVATLLALGVSFKSLEEVRNFVPVLMIAFITGGIMAIDKALRGDPKPTVCIDGAANPLNQ